METDPTGSTPTNITFTDTAATDYPQSSGGSDSTGAGSTLDAAKQQTREVLGQAKEQTREVVEQTKQKAGQLADQARSQIRGQLATQKERATGSLGTVAQALHQTGQQLHGGGQATVGDYADAIADQVERLSGYLRQRSVDDLARDAEDLARRQPALFLGSAFVLGLLAARFLKSSQRSGDGAAGTESTALVPVDTGSTRPISEPIEPITPPTYRASNYVPGGVAGTGNPPEER